MFIADIWAGVFEQMLGELENSGLIWKQNSAGDVSLCNYNFLGENSRPHDFRAADIRSRFPSFIVDPSARAPQVGRDLFG